MSDRNNIIRVKDYAITFCVPMTKMLCDTEGSPETLENMFITLRDRVAKTHEQKIEYDRVRALMKYASALWASRCEIKHCVADIRVTVHFNDFEKMARFRDEMEAIVESSAMT